MEIPIEMSVALQHASCAIEGELIVFERDGVAHLAIFYGHGQDWLGPDSQVAHREAASFLDKCVKDGSIRAFARPNGVTFHDGSEHGVWTADDFDFPPPPPPPKGRA